MRVPPHNRIFANPKTSLGGMAAINNQGTHAVVPEGIDPLRLPTHIAIIMDGNGRWAKQRGDRRITGHRSAITAVRDVVEGAAEMGIQFLTLFAFSTENWNRPRYEVNALMKLLVTQLKKEKPTLLKNGISLGVIGNPADLPTGTREALEETLAATAGDHRMKLSLALSYGSRADITHAVRSIAEAVHAGRMHPEDITPATVSSNLSTAHLPEPELLIRSSGEFRISNFMLWEIAYTEIVISPKLWPDFRREDLHQAIRDYQKRERRFGKTSEQVKAQ